MLEVISEESGWMSGLLMFVLVIVAGLSSGLTIGLISLDETNLRILSHSNSQYKKYADKIIPIRKNGYVLLITLLILNTAANESLPIVADRLIGTGWQAVVISTILVVIFGEIIPQVVCTRYGLQIGAMFSWLVRILIVILFPISWPMSKLFESILGKQGGTIYKREELKELLNILENENLSSQEVSILKGVLDLSSKSLKDVMTPLEHVYMLSSKSILSRDVMADIVVNGHSRIPIFNEKRVDILGYLIVKKLIVLDAEDNVPISKIPLISIPRFLSNTSLYEVVAVFQKGSSHIGLVIEGNLPVGIITLEDVIEEMIQSEIVDETDLFVDVKSRVKVMRTLAANKPWYTSPFVASKLPFNFRHDFHPIQIEK